MVSEERNHKKPNKNHQRGGKREKGEIQFHKTRRLNLLIAENKFTKTWSSLHFSSFLLQVRKQMPEAVTPLYR